MGKVGKILGGEFLVNGDYFNGGLPPARIMSVGNPDFNRGIAYYDRSLMDVGWQDVRRNTAISPNGRFVFVKASSAFFILDMETETQVTLTGTFPTSNVACAAFSPDGLTLALGGTNTGYLWFVDLATMVSTLAPTTPPVAPLYMAYSPDGLTLLLTYYTSSPYAQKYDISTDTLTAFGPGSFSNFGLPVYSKAGAYIAKGYPSNSTMEILDASTGASLFSSGTNFKGGDFATDDSVFVWVTDTRYIRVVDCSTWTETVYDVRSSPIFRNVAGDESYASGVHALSATEFIIVGLKGWGVFDISDQSFLDAYNTHGKPTSTTTILGSCIAPSTKKRKLAGTVTDDASNPVQRTLVVLDDSTGREIGRGESDAVTGAFEIIVWSKEPATVIALPAVGEQPVGKARILPVAP